jgi:hypothetical protein
MRKVDMQSRRRLLDDFFKVDEAEVSFERFDGSMTPVVRRLVFERGDSVAAVVFDRDAQRLLLTEQFRFPTLEKGPGWLIEIIAGMIERGEQPEDSIRREIEEELGYRADCIEHVATFYFLQAARPNVSGCTMRRSVRPAGYRQAAACQASTRISGSCRCRRKKRAPRCGTAPSPMRRALSVCSGS